MAEQPLYWSQTEHHKQAAEIDTALFRYQQYLRALEPDSDRWRAIYRMRCDIGQIENAQAQAWMATRAPDPSDSPHTDDEVYGHDKW